MNTKMMPEEGDFSSKKINTEGTSDAGINQQISALIVDDDPIICRLHSAILSSLKVKVETAVNGKEAVDLFRSGANFDIVFMDWEMPVMNGIEATKELRDMGVTCTIVGVTSRDNDAEKKMFLEAGLDFFHQKPLNVAMATHFIEQLQKPN